MWKNKCEVGKKSSSEVNFLQKLKHEFQGDEANESTACTINTSSQIRFRFRNAAFQSSSQQLTQIWSFLVSQTQGTPVGCLDATQIGCQMHRWCQCRLPGGARAARTVHETSLHPLQNPHCVKTLVHKCLTEQKSFFFCLHLLWEQCRQLKSSQSKDSWQNSFLHGTKKDKIAFKVSLHFVQHNRRIKSIASNLTRTFTTEHQC